jgi:hypothetical protein
MVKRWWIMFFLILTWSIFGQRRIVNSNTPAHIQISKTNFYVVPPTGFVHAVGFSGLTNPSLSADLIFHIIELPLGAVHEQMSASQLAGQGLKFISEEKLVINGSNGYLVKASFLHAGARWLRYTLIVEGDKNPRIMTHVVQGNFPDDKKLSVAIENSMLSFVYKIIAEKPLVEPFTVQYSKFGLKWKESTTQGNTYEGRDASGTVVTLRVTVVRITSKSAEKEMILYDKIKQLPYSYTKLNERGIEEIKIDDLNGLHASITAFRDDDSQEYAYMLMLVDGESHYIFTATSLNEVALEVAKTALQTFKRK